MCLNFLLFFLKFNCFCKILFRELTRYNFLYSRTLSKFSEQNLAFMKDISPLQVFKILQNTDFLLINSQFWVQAAIFVRRRALFDFYPELFHNQSQNSVRNIFTDKFSFIFGLMSGLDSLAATLLHSPDVFRPKVDFISGYILSSDVFFSELVIHSRLNNELVFSIFLINA